MSRWLVLGAGGMLGHDLLAALRGTGLDADARTRADLDITDRAAVGAAVASAAPDVVVNCAAWTAVDDAESAEDKAMAVNGTAAAHVAAACAAAGARLVHMSTDYVFSGDADRPYAETDPARPRTAYGHSKLAGERAVRELLPATGYVLRTAWLYGAHGPNFVSTMIRLERDQPEVDVVTDQRGQPTWTADVAAKIVDLGRSQAQPGIYHATSSGESTWFGLAQEIFGLLGADPARVRPVTTAAFPRPAPRPSYSVLGHGAWAGTGIEPIGDWRCSLRRALPSMLPPGDRRSLDLVRRAS